MRIPARLRRVSKKGLLFVAEFEGLAELRKDGLVHAYADPVGYATIGYGHLIRQGPVHASDRPITREQALALLRKDAKEKSADHVRAALAKAHYRPTQAEFDALVSLIFNLGPGILGRGHTLGDALRSKTRRKIADAFLVYDKAGGHSLEGLSRRRQRERHLFLSERYH